MKPRRLPALWLLCLALPAFMAAAQDGSPRSWEDVARFHFERYPAMEAADLYKLVAQGVGGNRHLLADAAAARRYLERELSGVEPRDGPLCEPVAPGGALLRVHLAPFLARGLSAAALYAAMLESAGEIDGGAPEFSAVWQKMIHLAEKGRIPVPAPELVRLAAVSFDPLAWTEHSAAFEQFYRPHYRVVSLPAFRRHFPQIPILFGRPAPGGESPGPASARTLAEIESRRVELPNGWKLTPVGQALPLGDLPLNMAVSHAKKYLAVTNNGQSDQSLQLIGIRERKVLDSAVMAKAWLGLAFSDDDTILYASGGNDNLIARFAVSRGRLRPLAPLHIGQPWPEKISIAGIALDDRRKLLYAVTKEDNSLYVLDLPSGKVLGRHPLGGEGYTCLLSPDRKMLYISCWGCDKVLLFATDEMRFAGSVVVGDNPNDLCLDERGAFLFVANANDNTVSVIDTGERRVVETLNTALFPDAPSGSTPNGLALSEDGKTLYVANADNNCLAVFDVSRRGGSSSKGFIPCGWYPSCVRVAGGEIFVANGKGLGSCANPLGPDPTRPDEEVVHQQAGQSTGVKEQYIGGLFRGALTIVAEPGERQLAVYSQAAYRNTPYSKSKEHLSEGQEGNPIPMRVGDASPIRYVFYIIKENRTYDQVLGDMPEGNGDPGLVLFGERITPNQHALAREFVLLDNFYVDGEVSADGHNWSLGAYATDYLEKNWPTNYGDRGGSYDAEGTRAVANNKHFLWDFCKRFGVTYRTYGEFADDYQPNIPVLKDHFCPFFTSWDQRVRDIVRFWQWQRDFESLRAAGRLPRLNTLRFINDHTEGLKVGRPTPFAHVADNDLAVGLFVDYLSHSPIWNECAVFIVEDDAQNGPDHVDAHRTTAYVAGGFVKEGFVDHTPYSTSSMLRTIELILGLPPMSQFDAAATPMWRCFGRAAGHPPFRVRPCRVDLEERNSAAGEWAELSESFDFAREDLAPDAEFNQVIWKAVHGLESECPAPVHAAFFQRGRSEEE